MVKKSKPSLADLVQASREKALTQRLRDQAELLYLIAEKTARIESTPPGWERPQLAVGIAVDFTWIGRTAAARQRRHRALTELEARGLIVRAGNFVRLTPAGRATCDLPPDDLPDFG